MIPPHRVRQLAGAANAAMGDDLIWIIGIDEDAKTLVPIDQSVDPADWWAGVQTSFDDGVAPDLTFLWVPVEGGRVLALHFSTDRSPYVVKAVQGGSPELEVPWRAGTRTRSAKRHELLRLLLPAIRVPEAILLSCTGRIGATAEHRLDFQGRANVYIEQLQDVVAVLPSHQMTGTLTLFGESHVLNVQPSLSATNLPGGIEQVRDGIYCRRPAVARLGIGGQLTQIEGDTGERLRDLTEVQLMLQLGVAGATRPIRIDAALLSSFDRRLGPTTSVQLALKHLQEG